jgi:hypothetical protein
VVFEFDKFPIPKLFFPVGQVFWNDVGMNIYGEEARHRGENTDKAENATNNEENGRL